MPCVWREEDRACTHDTACNPVPPLPPPPKQLPWPLSPPPPRQIARSALPRSTQSEVPAPPNPPRLRVPCKSTGLTRRPGSPKQPRLSPLPGSCEFAVASWLPLQDATGCNGAAQQLEVRPAVAGDWAQAVVESINATAVLVIGLEVGLGLLYRFRLRSHSQLVVGPAGESTGLRFADGSSPLAAPGVSATSSSSVLLNWSRGHGCDEGTYWTIQVSRAVSGSYSPSNGPFPATAQWETLGNSSATFVAYPLQCPRGCTFRLQLLHFPEEGFGDESALVFTPALPSIAPNAVRTLLTLRADAGVAQKADLVTWQERFAHALEKRLRIPRVAVVEVQRLLGPGRWIVVDLRSGSKADALRLAMHLTTALRDGTLDGTELDAITAVVRLLADGTHQLLEVHSAIVADGISGPAVDDRVQNSQAWTYLVEASEEHASTLTFRAEVIALVLCACGVVCSCYYRARRQSRRWAGKLASRMAARRRPKGHTRLHREEGSWGCSGAVPTAANDEVGTIGHLLSEEEECDVYVTSLPGIRPLCTQVKHSDLRRQPSVSCLKDELVKISFRACHLPFVWDDAARIE